MPPTDNIISLDQFRADRDFIANIEKSLGGEFPEMINDRFAQLLTPEDIPHGFDCLDDDYANLRRSLIQFIHSVKTMLIGGCKDKMFRGSLPFGVQVDIATTPVEAGARTSQWSICLPGSPLEKVVWCTVRWLPAGTPSPCDYTQYSAPMEFQENLNLAWAELVSIPEEVNEAEVSKIIQDSDRMLSDGLFLGAMRDAIRCLLITDPPMDMEAEPQDEDLAMNPIGSRYIKGGAVAVACESQYQDGGRVTLDMIYDLNAVRRFLNKSGDMFQ